MGCVLKLDEYCWAVHGPDPNDGIKYPVAYFTSKGRADAYVARHGGEVRQTALWHDPACDDYYLVKMDRVRIDLPDRADVLKKLTPREREALGIKP